MAAGASYEQATGLTTRNMGRMAFATGGSRIMKEIVLGMDGMSLEDRVLSKDIEAVVDLMRSGTIPAEFVAAVGKLH